MSGTDHSQGIKWQGSGPVIVLVNPQMGENIGASARAMYNFGLDQLRLVAPRDAWPNPSAQATASGASAVLDHVQIFDTLSDALADRTHVYATTARNRNLTNVFYSPTGAIADAQKRMGQGERIAILFGAERAGLTNADIALANALISIPVNPAFASLNLAQAVLVLAYEWRKHSHDLPAQDMEMAGAQMATQQDVESLMSRLDGALSKRGFFFPEAKADNMRLSLRNMLSRLPLTQPDVRIWHGIIRNLCDKTPKV